MASNSAGSSLGSDLIFTTGPGAPKATTLAASGVTGTNATLNGTVTTGGYATTAYFRYGLTTNYGASTPERAVGSGAIITSTGSVLSNLVQNTTYHFRLVAYNLTGTNYGEDRAFTTLNVAGAVAVLGAPVYSFMNPDIRAVLLATGCALSAVGTR